jgi:hypothetical protein
MFTRLMQRPQPRSSAGRNPNKRAYRPFLEPLEDRCLMAGNVVLDWNQAALAATIEATNPPPLAARNVAMVHAAVYDAVNAIDRTSQPYFVDTTAPVDTSREAAAAAAAYRVLVTLYPLQVARFDLALAVSLAGIPDGAPLSDGIALGHSVADAILQWRSTDGFNKPVAYTPGSDPGDWQRTLPAFAPPLLPHWGNVTPFTMTSGDQFRLGLLDGPPALDSQEYTDAFNEVKELGASNSTSRCTEETEIARFWADSSVTHWNQIAATVSTAQGLTLSQNARLFALMNLATADAYIASFEAKYEFDFWRPVTAIRAADTDGNPDTAADPNWTPLIVTPPMPAYTSGHATFGAAAAVALAGFFGTDAIAFTSTSLFLPGVTRSYASFSEAADENARSRLLAGIHWSFDNDDGQTAGRALGDYVVGNFLIPAPARVASVVVNDGLDQRSMVTSLTVTFDGPVTLDSGAFELRGSDGSLVDLNVTTSVENGRTVAVLTFAGADVIGGSLADGSYTLTILSEGVHDRWGRELDGDGDGEAGGNRLETFFRLFGDSDGDGDVDKLDRELFRSTFEENAGEASYLWFFDFNGDGDVDGRDNGQFNRRFGQF